jgi:hypothetical protein
MERKLPARHAPDWSLSGREKVVEKNGPFSLLFCQIVALMLPHRSVFAGCLLVAILFPCILNKPEQLRGPLSPHRKAGTQTREAGAYLQAVSTRMPHGMRMCLCVLDSQDSC